jgi:cobalt-zinc-cadmium efflux system protein
MGTHHDHHGHSHAGHSHGGHAHGAHSHAGHSHDGHGRHDDERRLLWALGLTGSFMIVEAIGGFLAGSLALVADAGHMLTDTAALWLAWFAARVARRPATPDRSYGQHRFQVLAAFVNGATLIAIAAWIVIEAAQRFFEPVPVAGGLMLIVAVAGLAVNGGAFFLLHGGGRENLNVQGALLHVVGDLLGSVAAIVAAGVILATGWTPIDPILSVLVALLILRSALAITRRSWHLLMEGTPEGIDVGALRKDLMTAVPGVVDVHHLHVWALTPERPIVTLHARIADAADDQAALHALQDRLSEAFGLHHATIQIERGICAEERPRRDAAAVDGSH